MHPAAIGPFKIERELGRGGMGEVFLARDTRLDRPVAIKALPAHLAQDPDRLARFQREAKVLASLNHSGIAAIYGLEEAGGHQYLILEYVEGETLADRLARGPVPVDESLSLAKQIAEALEVAHEKGVIHRDLKPGNVMVTPDGVAKVLDFGLARTGDGSASSAHAAVSSDSPTVATPGPHSPTIPGVIMGTAGYMSPEQARGKPVDRRSDIFSFGCVLYEMLTGDGPFPGETVSDSLGAILHREPSWEILPASTPARVRDLLTACLAKDRRDRLHDMGDARLALERAIAGREWAGVTAAAPSRAGPWRWVAPCIAGGALLGAGWLLGGAFMRPRTKTSVRTFHVSTVIPSRQELTTVVGIAPDASFVVYRASEKLAADSIKPEGLLALRRLDRDESRTLDGTEGAMEAALSANGRWIAFTAANDRARTKVMLKKLALDDGRPASAPETLCELPPEGDYTLCWSSERDIVLASSWQQTIMAVPASGGEPRIVLRGEPTKDIDNWGEVRPFVPAKSVLATRWAMAGRSISERVEVVDLETGERKELLANAGAGQLVGGEYVVARRNSNSLVAARVDPKSMQVIGEPVTVHSGNMRANFFVSDDGTLAMTSSATDVSSRKLVWLDDRGRLQAVDAPPRAYGNIMISPDGERVLTNLESANDAELPTDLWVQDLARGTFNRIPTQFPSWDFCWTPDGRRVTYATVSDLECSIWERRADGAGEAVKMFSNSRLQTFMAPLCWAPDGKTLAIVQVDFMTKAWDVFMLEYDPGTAAWAARPYLTSTWAENFVRFSSDGKWVSFVTDEAGRMELYIQRFNGASSGAEDARMGRVQVSTRGTLGPGWWSSDGTEIRYFSNDLDVMSVRVQTTPQLSVSQPQVLYSVREFNIKDSSFATDGRVMLALKGENERATKIDFVVNFLDELRVKAAAGK